MNDTQKDLIYLLSCAVNGITPDNTRVQDIDLEKLYKLAKFHSVTAAVCIALKRAGIEDKQFDQAYKKAVRKNIFLDMERTSIIAAFEEKGIWYMPLKGSVLKDLYPENGMRQMADFDILFDKEYAENVRDIMFDLGFTCECFGVRNHDVYFKQPVSNFEMHTGLFGEANKPEIYEYYENVKERLIKDDDNDFGYHFSNEDLYIYLTAHEYKHFSARGTGLRSLLDTYVFLKKYESQLDTEYISAETKKLGISDFEQQNRSLALHLFGDDKLTEDDSEMLEYVISSGTYGTLQNSIENSVKKNGGGKKGKRAYIKSKLFLPLDIVKAAYPFYYKHKALLPVLFVYRLGKAVTVKRNQTKRTIKILKKIK